VRREHRADRQPARGRGDLVRRYPALGDQPGRLVEPAAAAGALAAQLPGAVYLLGHVGEVEVGGEGAGELRAGTHVDGGQPAGGLDGVRAHGRPYLLDEVEQRLPLLPDEGAAEQLAQPPDVGAQGGVGIGLYGEHGAPSGEDRSSREDRVVRTGMLSGCRGAGRRDAAHPP
jgi:hypothetical protein